MWFAGLSIQAGLSPNIDGRALATSGSVLDSQVCTVFMYLLPHRSPNAVVDSAYIADAGGAFEWPTAECEH